VIGTLRVVLVRQGLETRWAGHSPMALRVSSRCRRNPYRRTRRSGRLESSSTPAARSQPMRSSKRVGKLDRPRRRICGRDQVAH
jgi:hypothetical protein